MNHHQNFHLARVIRAAHGPDVDDDRVKEIVAQISDDVVEVPRESYEMMVRLLEVAKFDNALDDQLRNQQVGLAKKRAAPVPDELLDEALAGDDGA